MGNNILKLKFKRKFLKKLFRREDPMKFRIKIQCMYTLNIHFLGKNLIILLKTIYKRLSSRDNSIIFIKDLIGLNVCDLDVELNFYICVAIYIKKSVRLNNIYMI